MQCSRENKKYICTYCTPSSRITLLFFQPPIVPQVTHPGDSRNFDKYPEDGWLATPPVTEAELEPFKDF